MNYTAFACVMIILNVNNRLQAMEFEHATIDAGHAQIPSLQVLAAQAVAHSLMEDKVEDASSLAPYSSENLSPASSHAICDTILKKYPLLATRKLEDKLKESYDRGFFDWMGKVKNSQGTDLIEWSSISKDKRCFSLHKLLEQHRYCVFTHDSGTESFLPRVKWNADGSIAAIIRLKSILFIKNKRYCLVKRVNPKHPYHAATWSPDNTTLVIPTHIKSHTAEHISEIYNAHNMLEQESHHCRTAPYNEKLYKVWQKILFHKKSTPAQTDFSLPLNIQDPNDYRKDKCLWSPDSRCFAQYTTWDSWDRDTKPAPILIYDRFSKKSHTTPPIVRPHKKFYIALNNDYEVALRYDANKLHIYKATEPDSLVTIDTGLQIIDGVCYMQGAHAWGVIDTSTYKIKTYDCNTSTLQNIYEFTLPHTKCSRPKERPRKSFLKERYWLERAELKHFSWNNESKSFRITTDYNERYIHTTDLCKNGLLTLYETIKRQNLLMQQENAV